MLFIKRGIKRLVTSNIFELSYRLMETKAAVDFRPAPYKLVDIGANLTSKSFNNRELDDVIQRAKGAGVSKIMVTGSSINNSKEGLRLARLYPNYIFCTAGIHPHDAKQFDQKSLQELIDLAGNKECVAIGECGLDFNRNFSPPEDQLKAFEAQVDLACKLGKPLFIHEREAHSDLVRILTNRKSVLPPTVIHCFTGTVEEAKSYLELGFYIGLTGFLWKDKLPDGVQYALKNGLLPLNRLLIETDAPFMYPNIKAKKLSIDKEGASSGNNVLGRISQHAKDYLYKYCSFNRNEPCSLAATCELIAAFMNVPADDVAFATTVNAVKIFGLTAED